MAAPIGPQQQVLPPIPPQPAAPVPAPAGVAAAPDTLLQRLAPTRERGVIQRVCGLIWEWLVLAYNKICGCLGRRSPPAPQSQEPALRVAPGPAAPAPAAQPAPAAPPPPARPVESPERAQVRALLDRLRHVPTKEQILALFYDRFSEEERDAIYFRLGETSNLSYAQSIAHSLLYSANYSRQQKIDIGRRMVERDPATYVLHLVVAKVEELAAAL